MLAIVIALVLIDMCVFFIGKKLGTFAKTPAFTMPDSVRFVNQMFSLERWRLVLLHESRICVTELYSTTALTLVYIAKHERDFCVSSTKNVLIYRQWIHLNG
jgi:hypothetical protein